MTGKTGGLPFPLFPILLCSGHHTGMIKESHLKSKLWTGKIKEKNKAGKTIQYLHSKVLESRFSSLQIPKRVGPNFHFQ